MITLLEETDRVLPAGEGLEFAIDKHGGRNFYAPMIQTAFPNAWATAADRIRGREFVPDRGHSRPITLHFRPRADSTSLPIALASMLAKYLREVFMRQFNAFWLQHVPGIEPTAGYPNDSKRFYGLIQRAMTATGHPRKPGLAESVIVSRPPLRICRNKDPLHQSTRVCSSRVMLENSPFAFVKCTTGTTMSSSRTRSVANPVAR